MTELQKAYREVGGLSRPSKMPCYSWGIPTQTCRRAKGLMIDEPNSICGKCYAMTHAYNWKVVKDAYSRRYESWKNLPSRDWVNYMVTILNSDKVSKKGYFRWFDSGDIQSLSMIYQLIEIAERTPTIKHWVATREYMDIVKTMTEYIPSNMIFRLSHTNIDELDEVISLTASVKNVQQSIVISSSDIKLTPKQYTCPSMKTHGMCGDCRACWNSRIEHVAYMLH